MPIVADNFSCLLDQRVDTEGAKRITTIGRTHKAEAAFLHPCAKRETVVASPGYLCQRCFQCAIELHENLKAITAWRATLPERERRRLVGAQANVKRWRKETRHGNGKCPTDLKRNAKAALKRFIWCLQSLPTHEAAPLCQIALAEVAAMCRA